MTQARPADDLAWQDLAACQAASPQDFNADASPDALARAQRHCAKCPVLLDCYLDALHVPQQRIHPDTTAVIRAAHTWQDGKPRPLRQCRTCHRWTTRTTYCSPACKAAHTCAHCGQPITSRAGVRYCGRTCSYLAARAASITNANRLAHESVQRRELEKQA